MSRPQHFLETAMHLTPLAVVVIATSFAATPIRVPAPRARTSSSASSAATARAQQPEVYRDPAGQFSVMVPPGWTATPQQGGVIIGNGNVSAAFSPFRGATTSRDIVTALGNQYGSQWRNFRSMDQGTYTIAGRPAWYAVFSGINPRGTQALLRLAGIADGQAAFAVIMSAPQDEFNASSRTLQSIEQSLTIGNGAGPMNAAPQSGGGALGIRDEVGTRGSSPPPNGMPSGQPGNFPGATPLGGGGAVGGAGGGDMNGARAVLGVMTRDVEPADLPRIGINERLGALIVQVQPGSAAEQARLMAGDLVLSADSQTIRQHTELQRAVAAHRPGETIQLIVMRQGKPLTLQVPLR